MKTNIKPFAWVDPLCLRTRQTGGLMIVTDFPSGIRTAPLYTRDALDAAVTAERERCAKLVEDMRILPGRDFSSADAAEINGMGRAFAKAIRKGEQR